MSEKDVLLDQLEEKIGKMSASQIIMMHAFIDFLEAEALVLRQEPGEKSRKEGD